MRRFFLRHARKGRLTWGLAGETGLCYVPRSVKRAQPARQYVLFELAPTSLRLAHVSFVEAGALQYFYTIKDL